MSIERLRDILLELVVVYEKALTFSNQKNVFLTASDLNNLERITKQEEELVRSANKLEATRKALVQDLAKSYDLSWKGLTLDKLLDVLPDNERQPLKEISLQLKQKVFDLAHRNEANAILIKNAISFVNYNINVLTQVSAEPTYGDIKGEGKGAAGGKSRIFDAKC